jgi:type II secretion system-associated lipoprotein
MSKAYKVPLLLLFIMIGCQKRLIQKEEMKYLNDYYKDKNYYLKDNFTLNPKELLKKGTSVKIWIESTPTLLKVKCYPSNEDRESALGKMVAYLINEDIRGKDLTYEVLEDLIETKLVVYQPNVVKQTNTKK